MIFWYMVVQDQGRPEYLKRNMSMWYFTGTRPSLTNKTVDLLQLEKVEIDQLENKTFILDDAAAFKQLETKVEEEI